jgi:hypothetical protein
VSEHGPHYPPVQSIARRLIGTSLNRGSIEPLEYVTERGPEEIPCRRQSEAGRHITRRVDRDTVASRITGIEPFPSQPRDIVLGVLPQIAGRNDIVLEQLLEDQTRCPPLEDQVGVLLSIVPDIPNVGSDHRQKSPLPCKPNDLCHFISVHLTYYADHEFRWVIVL